MKIHLKIVLLGLVFVFGTHSLFTNDAIGNFTFSGLNMSQPHVIVDGSGTKVLLWSMYPSQLQIFSINGTFLCQLNSTGEIKKIIWPSNSGPLVQYEFGYVISILDENTCETTKSYNISQILNILLYDFSLDKLTWIDEKPILIVSDRNNVYEIDLASQQLLNTYKVNNSTFDHLIQRSVYSGDFQYLYVQNFDIAEVSMTVKIYDTKKQNQDPIKNVRMPSSIRIENILPARDNSSIILYGQSDADYTKNIFTIDNAGNLQTKITRYFGNHVTIITDTNLFDTVAYFYPNQLKIELVRIVDGRTFQIIPFYDMETTKDTDYNHKTMAILLNTSQVLIYSYQPDQQDINPDEERGLPVMWLIAGVVFGVIIIGATAFFIIKKKKLFKKQEGNYGKIQDEV